MVRQDEDWLAVKVPTLAAWEGSRLKMVGLDALSTYKGGLAWFTGAVGDKEHYFQQLRRLNQGLDTSHWRVYEHKEETNGVRLVLSICNNARKDGMETIQWHRTGRLLPSGCQTRSKEIGRGEEEKEEEEGAEYDMVSTISFIQANLQHSMAASRILTRTVSVKGINMALIQKLWYCEDCIRGLYIPGYTLYSAGGTDLGLVSFGET